VRRSYTSKRASAISSPSHTSTHHAPQNRVFQLQRTIGNQATIQVMRAGVIQRAPNESTAPSRISADVVALIVDETLAQILSDPMHYDEFFLFCEKEHNAENLRFLEFVSRYRSQGGGVHIAKSIFNKFVSAKAPFQLNITGPKRKAIETEINRGVADPNLFDQLIVHVSGDLLDPLGRFKDFKASSANTTSAPPASQPKKSLFSRIFGR